MNSSYFACALSISIRFLKSQYTGLSGPLIHLPLFARDTDRKCACGGGVVRQKMMTYNKGPWAGFDLEDAAVMW